MTKQKFSKILPGVFILVLFFTSLQAGAQNEMPTASIKTTRGKTLNFRSLCEPKDTVILVTFWATWCLPCMNELETLNELYPVWQKEKPLKIIAISVDDSRTSSRVSPMVKAKGWTFDVYLDQNNDLKRALNINDIPFLLLIKDGKIRYQKSGYIPGSETDLLDRIKTL